MTQEIRPHLKLAGWCLFSIFSTSIAATSAGVIAQTLASAAIEGEDVLSLIDERDELKAETVLQYNERHETTTWENPNTGARISVTPTATPHIKPYQRCRTFTLQIEGIGIKANADATACKIGTTWTVLTQE